MNAKLNSKLHIALDVILLILTMTLFDKGLFGLLYHEIAGVIMLVIMIVHIAINIKMINGMCKNFSRLKNNIRACLIVDVILIACFIWIGISGVLCSHELFVNLASESLVFKLNHMFFGALCAVLLGIHIGLHICRKTRNAKIMLAVTALCLVLSVAAVPKSNMPRLLSISKNIIPIENTNTNTNANAPLPQRRNRKPRTTAEKTWTQIAYFAVIMETAFIVYWISAKRKNNSCSENS